MTITSDDLSQVFKMIDGIVSAGKNVRALSTKERVSGSLIGASVVVRATGETVRFVAHGGAAVGGALIGAATGIGVVKTVGEMAYNQYTKSEFGEAHPATYHELHQVQQLRLQEQLRTYKATVEASSQPERSRNLQKIAFGEPSPTSRRAEGLVGLQQIGPGLRDLPSREPNVKRDIVLAFTKGVIAYNRGVHINPSANSIFLAQFLDRVDNSSMFEQFAVQFSTSHKLDQDILKFMEDPKFPDNLAAKREGFGYQEKYMALYNVEKLQNEATRVRLELQDQNRGEILTAEERRKAEEEYDELYNIGGGVEIHRPSLEEHIRAAEKLKIYENMQISNIVSDEIMQAARSVQGGVELRTNPDLDDTTVTNRKLEAIIIYLSKLDPSSSLAKSINKELSELIVYYPQIGTLLDALYQKSLNPDIEGIQRQVGIQIHAPDHALDRGAALKFHKDILSNPVKRKEIMDAFQLVLDDPSAPLDPRKRVSLAQVATLMGKLDPMNTEDKAIFMAFQAMLRDMDSMVCAKLLSIPDNQNICEEYLYQIKPLLDSMSLASFASRGLRLENRDNTKGMVSQGFASLSKLATGTSIVIPLTAPVSGPIAAAFGAIASGLNFRNFACDISGQYQLAILHQPKESAEAHYKEAYDGISETLSKVVGKKQALEKMMLTFEGQGSPRELKNLKQLIEQTTIIQSTLVQTQKELKALENQHGIHEDDQANFALAKADIYNKTIDAVLETCDQAVNSASAKIEIIEQQLKNPTPDQSISIHY